MEKRDLRQLLVHRTKLVRTRTEVKNQLHALPVSQGVCRKGKLWSAKGRAELESLTLLPWAARRRKELLEWLDDFDASVRELDRAVEEVGRARPEVALLRTHPGIGMVLALAFVLTMGPIARFLNSRKLVSYLGLNPREHSSDGRQRLGAIIFDRFQDETNHNTIAVCQDHDTSIGNSSRKRKPSLPKLPISGS